MDKEEINETELEKEIGKEKIGIKISWWIAYPILILVITLAIFTIYKAFTKYQAIETISNAKEQIFQINLSKDTIEVGESIEVEITGCEENATLISSNEEIIKIEGKRIIGISEGEASIYAVYNNIKSKEIEIKCIINLNEIVLDKTELTIFIKDKTELKASLFPENSTYKELMWKSSDDSIVTVEDGKIEANKEGTAVITVTEINTNKEAKCNVTVKSIEIEAISLDEKTVKIGVGQNYILNETIKPNNASDQEIIWTSSDTSVISVKNGEIKAVGEGEAIVTASSKNKKTATCIFYVTQNMPENPKKYVINSFNVRKGPGTNYTKIATVTRNDEIEILYETNSYAKIRLSNGLVGYTILKSYSASKMYYIENVPFINQFNLGYPTGCEAVAATMAAQYAGYNIKASTIISNTPTDTKGKRQETKVKEIEKEILNEETGEMESKITTIEETVWVGENPFKYFVGHPTKGKATGSYGCFAGPIVTALRNSGISCTDISGVSIDTIFNYIQNGKPVIIWCRANAADLTEGDTWQYPDGSGQFVELVGEHCAVLIGYDSDYVYLNDPAVGKGVKQPKSKFISNWNKLYNQAIIIN